MVLIMFHIIRDIPSFVTTPEIWICGKYGSMRNNQNQPGPPEAEGLQAFGPHTLHIFHVLLVYVFIVIRYLSSKNNMGLMAHRYGFRLVENGGMDPYSCSRPYLS